MKAADYLAQHERMRGHFFKRAGRNLWDILWSIEVIGWREGAHLVLRFNLSTRYLGGGTCRGRTEEEAPPEIVNAMTALGAKFDAWEEGEEVLSLPDWVYRDPTTDTRDEYRRQGS